MAVALIVTRQDADVSSVSVDSRRTGEPVAINEFGTHPDATRSTRRIKSPRNDAEDPFSDSYNPDASDNARPRSIRVRTIFVEVGSSNEELGFDWVISPLEGE